MSGNVQFGTSTIKNGFVFLNKVLEKNWLIKRVTIEDVSSIIIMQSQPQFSPKILFEIYAKNIVRAEQQIKGKTIIEIIFSFFVFRDLVASILGTLQPKPVIKLITSRPHNPNFSSAESRRMDILDMIPIC